MWLANYAFNFLYRYYNNILGTPDIILYTVYDNNVMREPFVLY